jgi:hypothetical protein
VKLIGVLVDTETGEMLWRDFLIEFGDTGYRGGESDAENIDGKKLAGQLHELNGRLAARLVDCLNGKQPPAMPIIVGMSRKIDFTF